MTASLILRGAGQVLRPPEDGLPYLRHDRAGELRLEPGSIVVEGERVTALAAGAARGDTELDASGGALVPGFVDCHTHLPFAGWRAAEYAEKVAGVPYAEIARRGGGIRSSARALAAATDEEVLAQARALSVEMLRHGTTALETKTGYGLSVAAEQRSLHLATALAARVEQTVRHTALLAHAVPDGFDAEGWLALAPELADAARDAGHQALDLFVESTAFDNAALERLGRLAAERGLALRAHVEQFATHRSIAPAIAHGARSVDHLACLHGDDVALLAASECAAVLLPGAELLGDEHVAPGRALADAGAIGVLATDLNPGTSPITSLPLIVGLAVRRYGWTVREALLAVTLNAAWVLGLSAEHGSLEVGKRADVLLLDAPVEQVPYRFGHNPVIAVVLGGRLAWLHPEHRWRV